MADRFTIHEAAKKALDSIASQALQSIKELELNAGAPDSFKTDRVITSKITDDNLSEEPVAWIPLISGQRAFTFLSVDKKPYGLTEESYTLVEGLVGRLLKIKWVQSSISEKFIVDKFVRWARVSFYENKIETFSDFFVRQCAVSVRTQTVWAPVQYLEVETEFQLGAARIVPMTKMRFDELEEEVCNLVPDGIDDVSALFDKMRQRMQGFAAVVVNIEAEPAFAMVAGRNVCEDAIALLRLFSDASVSSSTFCPVALLDAFKTPQYHMLITRPGDGFSYSQGMIPRNVAYWRLSKAELAELESDNLQAVGRLLDISGLTEFGKAVRSATLAFSRALTFPNLSDRVLFALSAVEGLFLKNGGEPIQQNVGDRMAFLIATDVEQRRAVVENLKRIYKIRSQYIHHRVNAVDASELDDGFVNIRSALCRAIANVDQFESHSDFIEAIEDLKYRG